MAIYIAAVRLAEGGTGVEHIAEVIWMSSNHASGKDSVVTVVSAVDENPGLVKVSDGNTETDVEVVRPQGRRPYIRTTADRSKRDNLLDLPRY